MRVASFNVGCKDLSHFVEKMAADNVLSSADVVFLQEIEEYHGMKEIKEMLSHFGYYHFAPSRTLEKGEHGIALLSKLPIQDFEAIDLPQFNLGFRSRKRIAIRGKIDFDGTKIQVCNVHLDSRLNIDDRISQLSPLMGEIKKDSSRIILGGDFNTIPLKLYRNVVPVGKSDQFRRLDGFMRLEGFETFEALPKYSMSNRGIRWLLDHIYVRGLKIRQYGVREMFKASDHYPIWADVEVI
jgi:endonuclease/exonuclease/phosphatase family metal-dependent hydrolase